MTERADSSPAGDLDSGGPSGSRGAFDLTGRVIVVSGAAGGIGGEAAIDFTEAGAAVVLGDVDVDRLERLGNTIRDRGGDPVTVQTDVTDKQQVDRLAQTALDRHGRIDGWANVAGVIVNNLIIDTTPEELDSVLGVNLLGTFWGVAAAGRSMGRGGAIVNISSAGADMPAPTISVYAMLKAAVNHLTRCAAVELGPQGIRVNAVAPGFTDTPMVQRHWTTADGRVEDDRRRQRIDQQRSLSPLGLVGEPRDQALAMRYLLSDASRFMTGQILRPNGGVVMP